MYKNLSLYWIIFLIRNIIWLHRLTYLSVNEWMPELSLGQSRLAGDQGAGSKETVSRCKANEAIVRDSRWSKDRWMSHLQGEAAQPFAVRRSLSKTGQRRFEFGPFLPWQNVFKRRKWIAHKPWQAQNSKWQWHFTAGAALTGGTTAAAVLWSNVSRFLSWRHDTACSRLIINHMGV